MNDDRPGYPDLTMLGIGLLIIGLIAFIGWYFGNP